MNNDKFYRMSNCLDRWLRNLEEEKSLSELLLYKGVRTVGLYGYGMLGKHIFRELQDTNIDILWVADKDDIYTETSEKTIAPDEINNSSRVDLIIITSLVDCEIIEKKLYDEGNKNIIHIEELVDMVFSWGN